MSQHSACNESASINFNINIPSGIVKEYFNGMAKVESAKHSCSSESIWASVIPIIAPFVMPLITGQTSTGHIKTPKPKESPIECSTADEKNIIIDLIKETENPIAVNRTYDSENEEKKDESKQEVLEEIPSKKTVKKPIYEDGGMMHFNLGNGLGEGGLEEMMKMFGPMFQGLTSGLSNMTQQPTENKEVTPKSQSDDQKSEESCLDEYDI